MNGRRVVVVGGGIVGLASAYRILERWPEARLTVLEKEEGLARHQTGNNSGVLHCGLAYRPGTEKARLAVSGIRQMTEYCQKRGVKHEICGKLVVAVTPEDLPRMEAVQARGTQNGLKGLKWLGPEELQEIEPHARGLAALLVPEEGIVDYPGVCAALGADIQARGGAVVTSAAVKRFQRDGAGWQVETPRGAFPADFLVTCAGLHADVVARMAGEHPEVQVVPFRGEYYKLKPESEKLVRNLIYPVADPAFPFLGVHLTRMVRGGIEAGPNAVLAFCREGYTKWDVRAGELAEAITFPGLWRFIGKHPRHTWAELRRSFSKGLFTAALQRLVPELRESDLVPGGAGVRAQAMSRDGRLVEDFSFLVRENAVHVLNAPSPAATASLAIGEVVAAKVQAATGMA